MKIHVMNVVTKKNKTVEICANCGSRIYEQSKAARALQKEILTPTATNWKVA